MKIKSHGYKPQFGHKFLEENEGLVIGQGGKAPVIEELDEEPDEDDLRQYLIEEGIPITAQNLHDAQFALRKRNKPQRITRPKNPIATDSPDVETGANGGKTGALPIDQYRHQSRVMKSRGLTLNREQIETLARAHGFDIAGPDHPVYKEPVTILLKGSHASYAELRRAVDLNENASSDEKPLYFNVLEDGTIRSPIRGKVAVEEAKRYFEDYPSEILDEIGVEVIDGEHPGSTYFAARLKRKIDISEANKVAKKLGLPFRFKNMRRR
ncbi:hypothetical protein [Limnohabitans sp.]|uniref:hypothetical protein n=1 Tax=Limnohabitans sp. TaxID=1907725 RepID=UPI002896F4B5|nr:hypothetical protein [Limnohabitans sp.]